MHGGSAPRVSRSGSCHAFFHLMVLISLANKGGVTKPQPKETWVLDRMQACREQQHQRCQPHLVSRALPVSLSLV